MLRTHLASLPPLTSAFTLMPFRLIILSTINYQPATPSFLLPSTSGPHQSCISFSIPLAPSALSFVPQVIHHTSFSSHTFFLNRTLPPPSPITHTHPYPLPRSQTSSLYCTSASTPNPHPQLYWTYLYTHYVANVPIIHPSAASHSPLTKTCFLLSLPCPLLRYPRVGFLVLEAVKQKDLIANCALSPFFSLRISRQGRNTIQTKEISVAQT